MARKPPPAAEPLTVEPLIIEVVQAAPAPPAPLLSSMPGAAEVDRALVDQAVRDLNQIYTTKGMETARAIGEYVVHHFFAGDLDAAARFGPSGERHLSFRALSQRDDLQVSHAHLWVSVKVLDQLRQLPAELADALPVSHHRRLLSVRDARTKLRLAKKAVEKGLTVRAFEAEVAKARAKELQGAPRGRKPLPAWQKAVNALGKLRFDPATLTDAELEALPPERSGALVSTLDAQIQALEALRAKLQAR